MRTQTMKRNAMMKYNARERRKISRKKRQKNTHTKERRRRRRREKQLRVFYPLVVQQKKEFVTHPSLSLLSLSLACSVFITRKM